MFENFINELKHRTSGDNLNCIPVYYDFSWKDVFGHDNTAFQHGKSLTRQVKKDCPLGKTAALILTTRQDAEEIPVETDTHYAPVININNYLISGRSDYSATYLAASGNIPMTNAAKVKNILNNPSLVADIIEKGLTVEKIGMWASGAAGRWLQLQSLLQANNVVLESSRFPNAETLAKNLKWLSENTDYDSIVSTLGQISHEEWRKLQSITGIMHFKEVLNQWEVNKQNDEEEFWQKLFTSNPEIISQVFSCPVVIFKDKAYVGGKEITNIGGHIIDFLFKNQSTKNAILVEIKTPKTPLLSSEYRDGVYSISGDLSGAVNQTLNDKQELLNHYHEIVKDTHQLEAINPKCLLIAGSVSQIADDKKRSFEIFRNDLRSVDIITYDELFEKIRILLSLLEKQ